MFCLSSPSCLSHGLSVCFIFSLMPGLNVYYVRTIFCLLISLANCLFITFAVELRLCNLNLHSLYSTYLPYLPIYLSSRYYSFYSYLSIHLLIFIYISLSFLIFLHILYICLSYISVLYLVSPATFLSYFGQHYQPCNSLI